MKRNEQGDDVELLSAYVDGVSELSLDERKRVDDLLARDPALRQQESATRALIGELRDLPPAGNEPDWSALERSIGDAVGKAVPVPWYARLRWRFIVPGIALAITGAILLVVFRDTKPETKLPDQPTAIQTPAAEEPDEEALATSTPLWLDGTDLEVAIEAAELFDLDWDLDEEAVPETAELLPPTDLEWVDDLDSESLDRAEHYLERSDHRSRRGPT